MIADVLIVAAAAAFIVSFVERWVDHALIRGGVALVVSIIGMLIFGYSRGPGVVAALAAAYTALIMILIGERLATPPPIAIDPRRR